MSVNSNHGCFPEDNIKKIMYINDTHSEYWG